VYFTTSLALIGGSVIGFAVLVGFIGTRRAADRRFNLLFGAFTLAYGGWILAARAGYLATDVAGLVAAGRATAVFAALSYSLLVLYIVAYSELRPRALIYPILGCLAAVGIASLTLPADRLIDPSVEPGFVTLPWGETIRVLQTSSAATPPIWLLAKVAVGAYLVWAAVDMARRGRSRSALRLTLASALFLTTVVADLFVLIGVSDSVYVYSLGLGWTSWAVLCFAVVMSLDTIDRVIGTEEELRHLRAGLEIEVAERTAHLEAAQASLLVKTAEQATTAERDRLARELHDAVTQTLFSLNLIAGTLARLWRTDPGAAERNTNEVQRLASGALTDMRVLLREIRPHAVAETDLGTLVDQLSEGLSARHRLQANVHTTVRGSLPPDVHLAFYRVAQEAIHNVGKHADASRLTIDLTGEDGEVMLAVTDDGVGFDTVDETQGSMGLRIMQERADAIGAGLAVNSSPGAGTSVALIWPQPERSSAV
jgi:signal transduction histidine kinase